ncbi:MAG: phosphotransferase [Deltaproteobacteria bacterium]|nr:phosphotransferase [Deltaproteobacteria bacterium]
MQKRLDEILRAIGYPEVDAVTPLHAHASYRAYYRVRLRDNTSLILMAMPKGAQSVSEEITNSGIKPTELPFVNVARALAEVGLAVPKLLHESPEDRWLFLEDIGDCHLASVVAQADDVGRAACYRRAIDCMVALQTKTQRLRAEHCIALQRSFDATLLNWEFDHFREYGIEARQGIALPDAVRTAFEKQTRALTNAILEMPYGFTHRDFQSRNLMVRNDAIVLLDFQDALRGPYVYDLVALLRDSYVELSPPLVADLIGYFAERTGRDPAATHADFHRVTVQRKFKDAGRFVFIDRVKGNPDYLRFIPRSLGYAHDALVQLPHGDALIALLQPYVPEWRPPDA